MNLEGVSFRKYEPGDLKRCAALAVQAWPIRGRPVAQPGEPNTFEAWIESDSRSATWTEVAVVSGDVVGFLFGSVDKLKAKGTAREEAEDMLWMFRRVFSGDIRGWRISIRTAVSFFLTQFMLEINRPEADAEISLLIVDEKFRGRDIGKTLVDRFVKTAKEAGAHSVRLFTDDKISNWKFYEILGFRKTVSFYDAISTYFAGERANAIYYVLDFDKK